MKAGHGGKRRKRRKTRRCASGRTRHPRAGAVLMSPNLEQAPLTHKRRARGARHRGLGDNHASGGESERSHLPTRHVVLDGCSEGIAGVSGQCGEDLGLRRSASASTSLKILGLPSSLRFKVRVCLLRCN